MSTVPVDSFQSVTDNLSKVKIAISGLNTSLDHDDALLGPKDSAQLNVGLAFALGSLYYILLNCKGAGKSADGNLPINDEIDRIKDYVQRISKMQKEPETRKLTIDSEAASRLIQHNLDFINADTKKRKLNI